MRINWTEPALADIEAIYDFIARDREVFEPPYRIVYRVENDVVHIVRLVHGARDFDALRANLEDSH